MRYYYSRTDLFGSSWVECTQRQWSALNKKGLPVRQEHDTHIPYTDDTDDDAYEDILTGEWVSTTTLKDAYLEELRDKAPAIVSAAFEAFVEESDLKATPEEVQYFIDEELINPDYDEWDDEDEVSNDVITPPVASSSTNINRWFPRAAISIPDGKADINDIKRIQRAIYTLMENGMVKESDELDGDKFVSRLETHRDVNINTHQKNRANTSILFLPDFSPSCVSYAQLYNTLLAGVSAIRDDFNVVSAPHFNGLPKWFVINGVRDKRGMEMYKDDYVTDDQSWGNVTERTDAQKFYADVLSKRCTLYDISTVIIAGDMDGTWCYKLLLNNPQIERMIWVDGSYWLEDDCMKTRTSELLYKLDVTGAARTTAKSKLVYWSGVKTVADFVRAIERSNSW